jgi:hypothetical protein
MHLRSITYRCTDSRICALGDTYPGAATRANVMVGEMDMGDLTHARTLQKYRGVCKHGSRSIGHKVLSPHGVVLPPNTLAMFEPTPNQLSSAILDFFTDGNMEQYMSTIKSMLNGKYRLFR